MATDLKLPYIAGLVVKINDEYPEVRGIEFDREARKASGWIKSVEGAKLEILFECKTPEFGNCVLSLDGNRVHVLNTWGGDGPLACVAGRFSPESRTRMSGYVNSGESEDTVVPMHPFACIPGLETELKAPLQQWRRENIVFRTDDSFMSSSATASPGTIKLAFNLPFSHYETGPESGITRHAYRTTRSLQMRGYGTFHGPLPPPIELTMYYLPERQFRAKFPSPFIRASSHALCLRSPKVLGAHPNALFHVAGHAVPRPATPGLRRPRIISWIDSDYNFLIEEAGVEDNHPAALEESVAVVVPTINTSTTANEPSGTECLSVVELDSSNDVLDLRIAELQRAVEDARVAQRERREVNRARHARIAELEDELFHISGRPARSEVNNNGGEGDNVAI